MAIVTIRGNLGSGAPEIGKLVAQKLKYGYIDREIIQQVAQRIDRPQHSVRDKEMPPGNLIGKIIEALGRSSPLDAAYLSTWDMPIHDIHYLTGLKSVINELADSGSMVIRGRGSQFILKNYPGALHVLVLAPLQVRIKRLMKDHKLDKEAAKKEIEHFDGSRHEFTRRYFKAELEDPMHYDLVINTKALTFEDAASIVLKAIRFKKHNTMQDQS